MTHTGRSPVAAKGGTSQIELARVVREHAGQLAASLVRVTGDAAEDRAPLATGLAGPTCLVRAGDGGLYVTEVVGGVALLLGLLTPLGGAAVVGIMAVAFVTNHRGNGFFIFRPGEGWEYVMTLAITGLVLAVAGPGEWSLDEAFGLRDDLVGATGLLIALLAGAGGAAVLLALAWRAPAKSA